MIDAFGIDVRLSARSLLRRPAFLATSLLVLALGVGTTTAIFSLIKTVYFEAIPGTRDANWVRLYTGDRSADHADPKRYGRSARPVLVELVQHAPVFSDLILSARFSPALGVDGADGTAKAALVSDNYFTALSLRPALGRFLTPADDSARGASPYVVLSDRYWTTHFGRSPGVLGTALLINGFPFSIIGVAPPGFRGIVFDDDPDLYVPIAMQAQAFGTPWVVDYPDARLFSAMARLGPGIRPAAASAEINRASAQMRMDHPDWGDRILVVEDVKALLGGYERAQYHVDQVVALLSAAGVLLFLIASANVANLLVARAAATRKDVAIRLALGGGRAHLVRRFVLESCLLAVGACALGVVFAVWEVGALRRIPFLSATDVRIDPLTMGFAMALALLSGLILGLAVGLQATRGVTLDTLREAAGTAGRGHLRVRRTLVVTQLALSLVMVVGATLLLRSVQALMASNAGYTVNRVVVGRVQLSKQAGFDVRSIAQYDRFLEQLRHTPGVRSVTSAYYELLSNKEPRTPIIVPGYESAVTEDRSVAFETIGPDYFETLQIRVLSGRSFDTRDGLDAPPRAVVNEAMARRFWPGRDPIGRTLVRDGRVLEVIGVVGDVAFSDIRSSHEPRYYTAIHQEGFAPQQQVLFVRTAGDADAVAQHLQQRIREAAPGVPIVRFRSLADYKSESVRPTALLGDFLSGFGIIALVMAAVGLGGLMSFVVAQQTREIGIRLALGAGGRRVTAAIVLEAGKMVLLGVVIGVIASVAASRIAGVFVFGVSPLDPGSFITAIVILITTVMLAAYYPAARAARISPMIAMRSE